MNKKQISDTWKDHEVVFIEDLKGREERIKGCLAYGVLDFVVAGGDGTVNDVASLLTGTPARLGIIPLGSGNGLARDLGLPMHPGRALEVIRKGKIRTIDVGLLNERPFFCTAGIGFDALCAHDFASGKHSRGFWNYVKIVFRNYFSYQPVSLELEGNRQEFFSLTFANAGQFGNDAYIAPEATPDDGFLDCAMILPHPRSRFAGLGWRLVRKKLGTFPYFRTFRFKECVLTNMSDKRIHIDGEAIELDTQTIKVRILEKALNVITE